MAVNKVVYGTTTLVDLTEDTVTADSLLEGATAHNAAGEQVTGVLKEVSFDDTPTSGSQNAVTSDGIHAALQTKQDELTFDTTPTAGSNNPVTSDGIKYMRTTLEAQIAAKQDKLTFDTAPTSGSTNPVTSGGVYTADANVQSYAYNQAAARVYRGTTATANSTNAKVVTCNGFALSAGAVIDVYFTYGHTGGGTMTLNVNGTGAKTCYFSNSTTSPTIDTPSKYCSATIKFCYNGTYFICIPTVVSESRSVSTSSPWWYRKWSDGFIEQGAIIKLTSNSATSVTFTTAFKNMVQSVAVSFFASASSSAPPRIGISASSAWVATAATNLTGFSIYNGVTSSNYAGLSYYACGY